MQLLASDTDPSVRLAVATAARQFASGSLTVDTPGTSGAGGVGQVLLQLISASHDAKDPLLPYMIWLAGEPSFARNPRPALEWLAGNGKTLAPLDSILIRKGMRRICDTQDTRNLDDAVAFLERVAVENGDLALAAIDGLLEGQRAKPFKPQTETSALFDTLGKSENLQLKQRGHQLGALWGDLGSIRATLAAVSDQNLPTDQRVHAIDIARELKSVAAREALIKVVSQDKSEQVLVAAIRALATVGGDTVANDLIKQWSGFSPSVRSAATETLASRREWALELLFAVESNAVSRSELSLTVVRALADSKDQTVRDRTLAVVGRVRPANSDKQKIIAEKKKMILAGGSPDAQAGHALLQKTCLVCHKLYGEGADVGPDLTGIGRSTLDALLANVIDPNQVIGKGYENVEVETRDGRSVSGRLIENSATQIKLLSSGPKEEVLAKSDLASMRTSELSVMPEGLEQMPDADFRNLILYVLHPPQETSK